MATAKPRAWWWGFCPARTKDVSIGRPRRRQVVSDPFKSPWWRGSLTRPGDNISGATNLLLAKQRHDKCRQSLRELAAEFLGLLEVHGWRRVDQRSRIHGGSKCAADEDVCCECGSSAITNALKLKDRDQHRRQTTVVRGRDQPMDGQRVLSSNQLHVASHRCGIGDCESNHDQRGGHGGFCDRKIPGHGANHGERSMVRCQQQHVRRRA